MNEKLLGPAGRRTPRRSASSELSALVGDLGQRRRRRRALRVLGAVGAAAVLALAVRIIPPIAAAASAVIPSPPVPVPVDRHQASPAIAHWVMIFDDEFNSPALSRSQWNILRYKYPYNSQLQYYSPSQVLVTHGLLGIVTSRHFFGVYPYLSGMITTRGKFGFLYGKVVIRLRIPAGQGLLPAVWLLPTQGPPLPEIDMMETIGSRTHNLFAAQHWRTRTGRVGSSGHMFTGPDFAEGFHTITMTWEPGRITWSVDGGAPYTSTRYVPSVPMYLIINTSVGGPWPGTPDASTKLPQYFWIDYLRVYTKATPAAPPVRHLAAFRLTGPGVGP